MTPTNPTTRALLSAIQYSTLPMVLSDPTAEGHPLIAVNEAFEAMSGYGAAETLGRNCRFMQGPETDPETPRRIGRCLARHRGCIEWIVNHRRDGSSFWNLLFVTPVFDQDGTLLHYFGNQRDITAGHSPNVPDHTMGMADMPQAMAHSFHQALQDILHAAPAEGPAGRARGLERVVDAVRRVNEATLSLVPAPWSMPAL